MDNFAVYENEMYLVPYYDMVNSLSPLLLGGLFEKYKILFTCYFWLMLMAGETRVLHVRYI